MHAATADLIGAPGWTISGPGLWLRSLCDREIDFAAWNSAQIVVGMQHTATTSSGKVKTPKKAAVACLFSFTLKVLRRRLAQEIGCSRLSLCLGPSKSD
jgi:hypothetical protein